MNTDVASFTRESEVFDQLFDIPVFVREKFEEKKYVLAMKTLADGIKLADNFITRDNNLIRITEALFKSAVDAARDARGAIEKLYKDYKEELNEMFIDRLLYPEVYFELAKFKQLTNRTGEMLFMIRVEFTHQLDLCVKILEDKAASDDFTVWVTKPPDLDYDSFMRTGCFVLLEYLKKNKAFFHGHVSHAEPVAKLSAMFARRIMVKIEELGKAEAERQNFDVLFTFNEFYQKAADLGYGKPAVAMVVRVIEQCIKVQLADLKEHFIHAIKELKAELESMAVDTDSEESKAMVSKKVSWLVASFIAGLYGKWVVNFEQVAQFRDLIFCNDKPAFLSTLASMLKAELVFKYLEFFYVLAKEVCNPLNNEHNNYNYLNSLIFGRVCQEFQRSLVPKMFAELAKVGTCDGEEERVVEDVHNLGKQLFSRFLLLSWDGMKNMFMDIFEGTGDVFTGGVWKGNLVSEPMKTAVSDLKIVDVYTRAFLRGKDYVLPAVDENKTNTQRTLLALPLRPSSANFTENALAATLLSSFAEVFPYPFLHNNILPTRVGVMSALVTMALGCYEEQVKELTVDMAGLGQVELDCGYFLLNVGKLAQDDQFIATLVHEIVSGVAETCVGERRQTLAVEAFLWMVEQEN